MHLGGCTDLAIMQGEEMQHLEIGRFAQKYHVNFDWLLAGDLKGLRRMLRDHKPKATADPNSRWVKLLTACLDQIPPNQRFAAIEGAKKQPCGGAVMKRRRRSHWKRNRKWPATQ